MKVSSPILATAEMMPCPGDEREARRPALHSLLRFVPANHVLALADQAVVSAAGHRSLLAGELSTVKSMVTVNTSPIAQAVIGGVLVSCGYSLRAGARRAGALRA